MKTSSLIIIVLSMDGPEIKTVVGCIFDENLAQ